MPIKFGLPPLCKHPVFKSKESDCESATESYCEGHLRRMDPELECGETPKSQCLGDTGCENVMPVARRASAS